MKPTEIKQRYRIKFFVVFRLSVLLLNSMSKLIHNRCTCKLVTLRLQTCMQTETNSCVLFYVLIRYSLLFSSKVILKQLFASGSVNIYRLTHLASELSGFTRALIQMNNEREILIPHSTASCGIENFEFIVRERVQVNPGNSRAMSALTSLLFKLNTLQTKIVKL